MINNDIKNAVAEKLGCSWKQLARNLPWQGDKDIEASISNINADHSSQLERAYQMLEEWKKNEGKGATLAELQDALCKIGRKDIADIIKSIIDK